MKRQKPFSWTSLAIFLVSGIAIVAAVLFWMQGFQFQTYVNEQYRFQIRFPSDWTVQENVNGALVIFYSPIENQLDFFKDNINIVIQNMAGSMSLEEYTKVAVDQMKLVFGENMNVVELANTSLDGMPAKRFVFTGKGPQADLKYMSVWALDGSRVYQLTYLAIASQYNNHLLRIMAMLNSFRRLPPASEGS